LILRLTRNYRSLLVSHSLWSGRELLPIDTRMVTMSTDAANKAGVINGGLKR
jgi:hypothetical protein